MQVPRAREVDLVPFLAELERTSEAMGITDLQLSLTSLVGFDQGRWPQSWATTRATFKG